MMKMLCLASEEEIETEKKEKKRQEMKRNPTTIMSLHGAADSNAQRTTENDGCPWILTILVLDASQFQLKNRWSKTEKNICKISPSVSQNKAKHTARFTSEQESEPRKKEKNKNQFFISKRKIDNFWFFNSFHPILSHITSKYLLRKLLYFREATLGEKQNRKNIEKKTIKKLKWCYNLWSAWL